MSQNQHIAPYRFMPSDAAYVLRRLETIEGAIYLTEITGYGLRINTAVSLILDGVQVRNGVFFDFSGTAEQTQQAQDFYNSFPSREAFLDAIAAGHSNALNKWVRGVMANNSETNQ